VINVPFCFFKVFGQDNSWPRAPWICHHVDATSKGNYCRWLVILVCDKAFFGVWTKKWKKQTLLFNILLTTASIKLFVLLALLCACCTVVQVVYQMSETMFYHISKHWRAIWEYNAQRKSNLSCKTKGKFVRKISSSRNYNFASLLFSSFIKIQILLLTTLDKTYSPALHSVPCPGRSFNQALSQPDGCPDILRTPTC